MNDFTTTYNRLRNGSSKWLKMMSENANVSKDIIPLSVADMEFQPCEAVKKAINKYLETEVLGYSRPTAAYHDSIVNFFKNFHEAKIKPEWIVTSPGVVPAMATAVRSYTKQNDGVIIFTPIYPPFYDVVKGQNRRLEESPLLYINNRYEIDFNHFESLAKKDDVTLLLLCNPHNPGGRVWSKEELSKILTIANNYNLIVVADEIHADYIHNGKHIVLTSFEEMQDKVVSCTAPSKTFNLAGLQCSNILIPNEKLRNKFIHVNEVAGIERANVLGLVATQAAYNEAHEWLLDAKVLIKRNLDIVEDFFTNMSNGFKVMVPDAGFLSWVNFEGLGVSKETFYGWLLEADFYINQGEFFGKEAEFFIRINVGLPTKDLIAALDRLKFVFEKNNLSTNITY